MATQGFAAGRRQRDLAAPPRPSAVSPKRLGHCRTRSFVLFNCQRAKPRRGGDGFARVGVSPRPANHMSLMSYSDLFEGGWELFSGKSLIFFLPSRSTTRPYLGLNSRKTSLFRLFLRLSTTHLNVRSFMQSSARCLLKPRFVIRIFRQVAPPRTARANARSRGERR